MTTSTQSNEFFYSLSGILIIMYLLIVEYGIMILIKSKNATMQRMHDDYLGCYKFILLIHFHMQSFHAYTAV